MVSDLGNVKSLERVLTERRTKRVVRRNGKLLKHNLNGGYYKVGLGKAGAIKMIGVHRLVALAFVPGHSKKKYVTNHKNGNKLDNRAENLEWCTVGDNLAHAYKLGLKKPFRGDKKTKLDERKVRSIKRLAIEGARTSDIARAHGTTTGIVRAIRTGRSWRYISA